jgi:hypothetical protein
MTALFSTSRAQLLFENRTQVGEQKGLEATLGIDIARAVVVLDRPFPRQDQWVSDFRASWHTQFLPSWFSLR